MYNNCTSVAIHDGGHERSSSAVRPGRAHAGVRLRRQNGARRRPATPVLRQVALVISDGRRRTGSRAISQHQSIMQHQRHSINAFHLRAWSFDVIQVRSACPHYWVYRIFPPGIPLPNTPPSYSHEMHEYQGGLQREKKFTNPIPNPNLNPKSML